MKELTISLGERSYPVRIGHGAAGSFPAVFREQFGDRGCALVTNSTLAELYAAQLAHWQQELGFVRHVIPDGEQYKTVGTWAGVLDAFLQARVERSAIVIAFGGGVVGDITGFAASALLRGVEFIQVPTTLLAMVDSSVGGKTGVNHAMGKNLIGAFHQPRLVWVDTAYLQTLPRREFVSGYAELFKTAFIGGRAMFDFVRDNHAALFEPVRAVLAEGIELSVRIKAQVVEEDEREEGRRALLNFGHTFAHAFEVFYGYDAIMHGEAVLWGMACACELGRRIGSVPAAAWPAYESLLGMLPLPALPDREIDTARIYDAMFSDKKTRGGKLRFVVPAEPGESVVRGDIAAEDVRACLAQTLARTHTV
jgi:3-dehydroquinate synthase